jgi:hypothetical protein
MVTPEVVAVSSMSEPRRRSDQTYVPRKSEARFRRALRFVPAARRVAAGVVVEIDQRLRACLAAGAAPRRLHLGLDIGRR